jgi:hypothetical protein
MKHKIFYPPKQLSNPVADPLLELEQLWSLDGGGSVKMNILRLLVLHTPLWEPPRTTTVLVWDVMCMDGKDRWDTFLEMDIHLYASLYAS